MQDVGILIPKSELSSWGCLRGGGGEWDRAGTLVEAFVAMGIKGYPGTHQCEDGDAGII